MKKKTEIKINQLKKNKEKKKQRRKSEESTELFEGIQQRRSARSKNAQRILIDASSAIGTAVMYRSIITFRFKKL